MTGRTRGGRRATSIPRTTGTTAAYGCAPGPASTARSRSTPGGARSARRPLERGTLAPAPGRAPAPPDAGAQRRVAVVARAPRRRPDLALLWRAYVHRFDLEHTFRFAKETLRWTAPRVRHPAQADRWTALVVLAYTQLRLAQPVVADQRLPWERPLRQERLTPGRVRRQFCQLVRCPGHAGQPTKTRRPPRRAPQRAALPARATLSRRQTPRGRRAPTSDRRLTRAGGPSPS